EVEALLLGPAVVAGRQRAGGALLVYLLEAAVRGRAGWQSVRAAELRQIRRRLRVVVGVDDRHRLAAGQEPAELVGGLDLRRSQTGRAGHHLRAFVASLCDRLREATDGI